MSKKKRRRRKPTARPSRKVGFLADILAGTVSGLITAAILKMFAARCYADLTMEASVVLSDVGDDMHRLGFTWAEIEDMELEAIA